MHGDLEQIYPLIGMSMAVAWAAPDDQTFAAQMTALCQIVWQNVRSDPWPDDGGNALAQHLAQSGVKQDDPRALVAAIMNYQVEDRKVH
ncbi:MULTISPECIES: hypothetical protein [unclassified Ruegeria]|uniref:hypothetical protein n=1 Tax=unclassified Ruegeria TaxID=2625375 RepID=UPI0014926B9C|nr:MULTISPECIES: hypothetical protein [unclassified Ruegeria]NOD87424.1 hypothetical protein [Ruegeria sp. HKCCD4318]NOE12979.1 hypothetical protein [Ruegeria sp. HKCCD4318-2]NOG08854.1 hypothetical protein [Ruegeria sp. HKCCD4315]